MDKNDRFTGCVDITKRGSVTHIAAAPQYRSYSSIVWMADSQDRGRQETASRKIGAFLALQTAVNREEEDLEQFL